MVVEDPAAIKLVISGGTLNTNPDNSLGGQISTQSDKFIISNFLHNLFDEVTNAEAVSGDVEYRHCYVYNNTANELRNVKLIFISNAQLSAYSLVKVSKGTADNGFVEQTIVNENTAPVGLDDSSFVVPTSENPILLGTIQPDTGASIWFKRQVFVDALLANNQKVHIRIFGDKPPGTGPGGPNPDCLEGQHPDPITGLCVDDTVECPEGQILDPDFNICVPDDGGQGGGGGDGSPPIPADITVVVSGDIGCSNDGELTYETAAAIQDGIELTTVEGESEISTLDMFIANGDLSYDSEMDCFVDNLENNRIGNIRDVTKITIGNHDDEEEESSGLRRDYLTEFGIPDGGFYSFDIQHVHFLMLDTQSDYGVGSPQHQFVLSDLEATKNNSDISWIVVCYHKPSQTAPSNHDPLTDFRDIYHPIWDQYHVDIIISGHNHNMQRTYPLKYNSSSPSEPTIVSTGVNGDFVDVDGRVFIVAGAGGDSNHDISGGRPSYNAFQNDSDNGVFLMKWVSIENTVACAFFAVTGDDEGITLELLDTFQLTKTITE